AAIRAGASAVLAAEDAAFEVPQGYPVVRVADPRRALARIAAAFYQRQPEVVVAVTGTNGKTSVASFTEQIWRHLGLRSGSMGTLGVSGLEGDDQVALTSPDPITLHRVLCAFEGQGVQHVALEASSHGLAQKRLDGVRLAGGAFTSFSRDHLDYHASFEDYLDAKLRLFREILPEGACAVINAASEASDRVLRAARAAKLQVMSVGRGGAHLELIGIRPQAGHIEIELAVSGRPRQLRIPLVGAFQAENALVAAALSTSGGDCSLDDAVGALEHLKGACGRLELVGATAAGARVFVDYAHTPDALSVALSALRPHATGRIIVVFGAGGDRDPGKRTLMGAAAGAGADEVIVTDDNPRGEDAGEIRRAILEGVPGASEIGDRRAAIIEGIARLESGDLLLIAGKGHERGQIVGDRVIPFSDHQEVARALGGEAAH
ncbi:MAG: UDP-N-acetylmuramoyl-L-alanyl-D-glutamate--2,6-diaminopimelate ligase, partial [Rhizobiales bacterium]|nr:UDP-N-acetylmuramoyl-L-alanyl-D-glutamate--2,6-diaminopimelate ligase [Hyphomicrobiales bacterium]